MTSTSTTTRLKRLTPSHKEWKPHLYQEKGHDFLVENGAAALFADPGTGKTSTTLAAFETLRSAGVARRMLVIAPRRVCQLVWWQESQEWSQFRHLRFAWLHNSRAPWDINGRPRRKDNELKLEADVYLINPEGVSWLYKTFYCHRASGTGGFPFDTVVVDELTKFKNSRSKRSKELRKLTPKVPRMWGLTGSPTPNGYEDLFGQMLLLDGGAALGSYYTHFRDKYFKPDGWSGFTYKLAPGAGKRIEKKIEHLVLRVDADDWLDMPKVIDNPIEIKLDDKSQRAYDELKKEMLLQVEDETVSAANAAALYSKLAQLANGAVYPEGLAERKVSDAVTLHDAKLEALCDLLEELGGQPLLVAYEFNHDLQRIKDYPRLKALCGGSILHLGKGTTDREVSQIEKDWNENKIRLLPCHPASAGHGLNFQKGGAGHVCWFSATWDFELYDQFIRRIARQGNTRSQIINHLLLVKDSIDELKYAALEAKDVTQAQFLQAVNTAFTDHEKETAMAGLKKLGRKKAAEPESAPETDEKPSGWGKKATAPSEETQREKIASKLQGEEHDTEAPVDAKSAFSAETQAAMDGSPEEYEAPKAKKTTKRKTTKKAVAEEKDDLVAARGPHRTLHISLQYDSEGNPVPTISATVSGDFDEDAAVRTAELVIAATEVLEGEDD